MKANIGRVVRRILADYALDPLGIHGVSHWARVWDNGQRLARVTGAEQSVVALFAIFHDSRRENEDEDPKHGLRGADFALQLRNAEYELAASEFELLYEACAGHTDVRTHANTTIQTCWDADRLDLARVGITPQSEYLCSGGVTPALLEWATLRSARRAVPHFVRSTWLRHGARTD